MKYYISLLLVFGFLSVNAQMSKSQAKDMLKKADGLLRQNQFAEAGQYFLQLRSYDPKEPVYTYRLGICYSEIFGKEQEAISLLTSIKRKEADEEYEYHLAKAYFKNKEFDKALENFQAFFKTIPSDNSELKQFVNLQMSYASNAKILMKEPMAAKVINLGSPINTTGSEYTPCVTPDEQYMIYTHRGERSMGGKMNAKLKEDIKHGIYYEDILLAHRDYKQTFAWEEPKSVSELNTLGNDAAVSLSPTGDKLVVFKSSLSNPGDLYINYFKDGKWTEPVKMLGDVNSNAWEGSASFSTDGSELYFSSEREGGYGGKDLYVAKLQKDGSWGEVHVLGPEVNSPHDEDAPYIHPDNKTLYFSSNSNKSMGGYDIFYTEKLSTGKWKKPVNAGFPINSIEDDRFYILSADGQRGYFSKKSTNAEGDQDLYVISPGRLGAPPVLALITGNVFFDGDLSNAEIVMYDLETGKEAGTYRTNPNSDEFSLMIAPGKAYKMAVRVDGKDVYSDTLDAHQLNHFMRLKHDYHVYSDDYKGEQVRMTFSLQKKFEEKIDEITGEVKKDTSYVFTNSFIITDKDSISLTDLNYVVKQNKQEFYKEHHDLAVKDHVTADEVGEEPGHEAEYYDKPKAKNEPTPFNPVFTAQDTVYRVQVAAYRKPKNYKWGGKGTYGDVLEVAYPDGITRFTIGGTKYLEEAESLHVKLIDYGIKDAFVVVFVGEKRIPLFEIVKARNFHYKQ